jgi:hypothetical protein
MKDVHKMVPSRYVLRTSAWAKGYDIDDQAKIHIRPMIRCLLEWLVRLSYAGGPAVWNEALYKSPADYYNNTTMPRNSVFLVRKVSVGPTQTGQEQGELTKWNTKDGWKRISALV